MHFFAPLALVTSSLRCPQSSPHQDIEMSNNFIIISGADTFGAIDYHLCKVIKHFKLNLCHSLFCVFCSQFSLAKLSLDCFKEDLDSKVDNFHRAHDGEPSEESQGAANC